MKESYLGVACQMVFQRERRRIPRADNKKAEGESLRYLGLRAIHAVAILPKHRAEQRTQRLSVDFLVSTVSSKYSTTLAATDEDKSAARGV